MIFFSGFFGQSGISSTNWREQPECFKGLPQLALFLILFVQQDPVATRKYGVWIDFCLSSFILIFRVFSPKPISMIRIVEYSTILVLEYFEDTLDNVVPSEAWLERD